jgi:Bacterial aa3 type cytochrome c oxidase subunit IV
LGGNGHDTEKGCFGRLKGAIMANMTNDTIGPDLAYHYETYRSFVRYTIIFVAHVALLLVLMAYFLA